MKKTNKLMSLKKVMAICLSVLLIVSIASAVVAVDPPLPGGGVAILDGGTSPLPTVIPVDLCDSTTNHGLWPDPNNSLVLDTADKQEGSGSIKFTGKGALVAHGSNDIWNGFANGPIALTGDLGDYALSFWVKTNNKTSFNDTCFDIAKNEGITESVETFWLKSSLIEANDTWTQIIIPLDAVTSDDVGVTGALDKANINAYRIRYNGGASDTLNIDNITILDASSIAGWTIPDPDGDEAILQDCEGTGVITSWPAGVPVDGAANPQVSEGLKSVKVDLVSGSNTIEIPKDRMGKDVYFDNTKDQYLVFDLYCADKTKVDVSNMQVALGFSSGAFSDANNMTWWIKEINTGWNRYILPFNYTSTAVLSLGYADVVRNGNGPVDGDNKKATNFFRAIVPATGATTLYLDNLRLITTEIAPVTEMAAPTATPKADSVTVNWTKAEGTANGDIGGYILKRYTYDAENDLKVLDKTIKVNGANTTSYVDSDGILADTTYVYDIKAVEDINAENLNVIATYDSLTVKTLAASANSNPTTSKPTGSIPDNTKTGDSALPFAITVIIMAAVSSVILVAKKVKVN